MIDTATHEGKKNDRKKECYEQNVEIHQKIWDSLSKNFETIECAQLSNSFITLMALEEGKGSMRSTQISELIANIQGQIYKVCATFKVLEHRLKREDTRQQRDKKGYTRLLPREKKLLKGWMSFLEAFD